MSSEGLLRISCPLGFYWRVFGETDSVLVAETATEAEARLVRQYYMAGFKAGHEASSVVSTVSEPSESHVSPEPSVSSEPSDPSVIRVGNTLSRSKPATIRTTKAPVPAHPRQLAVANGVLRFPDLTLLPVDPTLPLRAGRLGHHDPIPYVSDSTSEELQTFLQSLFPDPAVLEYVLCAVASCIDGVRRTPNLFLCYGSGSNGKSAFQSLVEMTLGDYAKTMAGESLCRKSHLSGLQSQLAGVRWIGASDPGAGALHAGTLQHLLESIVAHVFLFTNELPTLKADDAFWSQVRVIPFLTTFGTDAATPDLHLQEKLPTWRVAFLSLLVNRLTAATAYPRAEPERVLHATQAYRKANDPFQQFVSEYLIPAGEPAGKPIARSELRMLWREFRSAKSLGPVLPGDLKESDVLERLVGADGCLRGYAIRTAE
jgi:phage/plasmid-associated DNA primase